MRLSEIRPVSLAIFFVIVATCAMAIPGLTLAQCAGTGGFVPLECFERSALEGVYRESDFGNFVQKMFIAAISFGAIFAVFRLAWAGFLYIGSDLWTSKEKAKEIIRDTLLGLFLLLAIWLILRQINPDILNLKINITPAKLQGSDSPTATQPVNPQSPFTSQDGSPLSP